MYGGAAGGGKSDALLMSALQFVHLVPGYSALLLRRTFSDLSKSDGLIPRSHQWLDRTNASWRASEKSWYFPNGSKVEFGYLSNENDKYQYQGAAYQFIGWDELTQFEQGSYTYMFSRCRKPEAMDVIIRIRSGTNPGGYGHKWVKQRFIVEGKKNKRWFVPSKLNENPHLSQAEYIKSLEELDPLTRKQLLHGDWEVQPEGNMFKREWFKTILGEPPAQTRWVRYWDLAATEKATGKDDPDFTSGALVGLKDGTWVIADVKAFRKNPRATETVILQTAKTDGIQIPIAMEQEPGASGKTVVNDYQDKLAGYAFKGMPSIKDKVSRAMAFSSAAEAGKVHLVTGKWINDFLDEVGAFPQGGHDDQVDAVTGAMQYLKTHTGAWTVTDINMAMRNPELGDVMAPDDWSPDTSDAEEMKTW